MRVLFALLAFSLIIIMFMALSFGDESLKIKMTIIIASILLFVLSFIFKNRIENYNGKKYLT